MPSDDREHKGSDLDHAREKTPGLPPSGGGGRSAAHPQQIPPRGWKQILLRVGERVGRENISVIAAGVAFYAFLAIPSTLTALVALYGLAFDPASVQHQVAALAGVVPQEALKIISDDLTAVSSSSNSTLGISFVVALLFALYGARSGMSTLITALNIAYDEREKRGFFRFQLAAFALTAGAVVFAVVSVALVAVLPAVIGFLPLGSAGKTLVAVLTWPVLFVLAVIGLAAIYRYAPSRTSPKWRWTSWGATAAILLWVVGSALFSVYVGRFASYNKTYGSLGAVVVLMMWLYVSAFAVLLGAELNAEMERQTARDTTEGEEKPMGRRGATVADEARG